MNDINASATEVADPHAHVDARIGLLGDPHADFHWTKQAIEQLLSLGVKQIHVLGDFQFVGRKLSREKQTLRRLSNILKAGGAHMFVTGGNHEGYPALFRRYPADEYGYRRLDAHITWLPRGWRGYTDAGTVVASLGGANSIDRDQRNPPTTGLIGQWWPEERITNDDLAALGTDPVDVLLAHDAPPTQKLKKQLRRHRGFWSPEGRAYADAGQQMFHRGVEQVRPALVLSGHYHRFLDTTETFSAPNGEAFEVRSVILNRSRRTRSMAVLSVDTQGLEFPDVSSATKAPPVTTTAMARQQAADLAVHLSPAIQRALIRLLKTAYEQGLSDEELVSMLDLLTRVLVERVPFDRRALRTAADDLVWAGLYTAEEVAAADQQPHGKNLRALLDKAWDRTVEETLLTAEVARNLDISDSTVRRRAAENRLYSFSRGGKRRYPTWQFVSSGDQPLPHLSELLAAVPWRMSWSILRAFMISPKETLRAAPTPDGSSPSRMSPADWLADGRDVKAVLDILSTYPVHRNTKLGDLS